MKYGKNNSRAKASLARWVRRLSVTINALKRKPEGPHRALDNNAAEPDRTAVVTVFATLVSDGNLDFTNIPARPNPSLTITDDDGEPGGAISCRAISDYKIKSSSDGMNGVPAVNAPTTGAPMITGTSAHGPGWPGGEHRHGDHRRQHQQHRHGEQAGDGFGDGGKRQAADAGCGREPAECDARHRGRRHARHRAHTRDAGRFAGTPSESGYTVALTSEPTGPLTVTRAGGLTVATASNPQDSDFAASKTLTFTTSNWQTARTVTLRAGADSNTTDNTYTIGHTASGGDYGSVRGSLSVRVLDGQKSGATLVLTVDRTEIPEGGGVAVELSTAPGTASASDFGANTASIEIGGSYDYDETFQTTAQIAITPVDDGLDEGNETVTVTVRAQADPDDDNETAKIAHGAAGADYEGIVGPPVSVSVNDDDQTSRKVVLSLSPDRVDENAGSPTVTVTAALDGAARASITEVQVTVTGNTAQAVTDFAVVPPFTVTIPQGQTSGTGTFSFAPVNDSIDERDETVSVGRTVSGLPVDSASLLLVDDDDRGVTVSEMTLTLLEGGSTTYTVKLNSEPTGNVTVTPVVTVIGGGTRTVTPSPGALTFTKDDWNQAQTVTLNTADDNTVMGEMTVQVEHTASGGDYGSVEVDDVTAILHGLFIDGMTVTFQIPQNGIVTVPESTPVPAGIQLTVSTSLAGQTVSISPGTLPTDMPRGFRASNAAVDIKLGTTFSGEATVCLPSRGRGRVFRWDDEADPPTWVELDAPAAGSPTRLACGVTDRFSLFALGSAEQERVAKAWLARFGRTVAQHVTEAVQDRLSAPRAEGLQGTLAGQPLPAPGSALPGVADTRPLLHNPDAEFTGLGEQSGVQSRSLTARDLLTGSQFSLTREAADGSTVVVWGRGAVTDFDGRDSQASVDGNVTTGLLGADWASGPLVAGLALSISEGRGFWTLDGEKENVESSMAGLHPFIGYKLTDRLSVWGVAGYGQGELETSNGREKANSDIYMAMVAAGAKGDLLNRADGDNMTLSLKTDGLFVRIGAAASDGGMDKVKADASRLRVALEASRSVPLSNGSELEPSLEIGLRYDGGDAENGFGVDIGAGLGWTNPARGLKAEARARGLLTHEDDGFRELGFSGSFDWQQKPSSDRGAKLSLSQTVGGASSGGADTLFSRNALNNLAVNGNADGGEVLDSHRLEAKFGYGFSAFNDRFTWTPAIGIGRSDNGRDNSLGWRLVRGSAPGDGSLELSFEARRRESANDNSARRNTRSGSSSTPGSERRANGVSIGWRTHWTPISMPSCLHH